MQEMTMPVKSRIKVLLAERNLDRARSGERPISVRGLAEATGITHSALVKLVNGKSGMISFETLDKLMQFFGTKDLNEILEYVPPEERIEEPQP
jgi:DNA-binding Xre family transcriptional regulator